MNAMAASNTMLLRKGWWETRWIFLVMIGVLVLFALVIGTTSFDAASWADKLQRNSSMSEAARQMLNNFEGRIWTIWFKTVLAWVWTLYAIMLAAACHMFTAPYAPSHASIPQWTLSLPVSRRQMLLTHVLIAAGEAILMALIPSIVLSLAAGIRGQDFPASEALFYALLGIGGGAIFFGASYLATVLVRNWLGGAAIIAAIAGGIIGFTEAIETQPAWSPFTIMAGEQYRLYGQMPWLGLLISMGLCLLFIYIGIRVYEQRDL